MQDNKGRRHRRRQEEVVHLQLCHRLRAGDRLKARERTGGRCICNSFIFVCSCLGNFTNCAYVTFSARLIPRIPNHAAPIAFVWYRLMKKWYYRPPANSQIFFSRRNCATSPPCILPCKSLINESIFSRVSDSGTNLGAHGARRNKRCLPSPPPPPC